MGVSTQELAQQAARDAIIARFARAGYTVTMPNRSRSVLIGQNDIERLLAQLGLGV